MKQVIRTVAFTLIIFLIFTSGATGNMNAHATDVPPPVTQGNPLLPAPDQLFDFANVNTESIRLSSAAIQKEVKVLLSGIYNVEDSKRTFGNTMLPFDDAYNLLQRTNAVYILLKETSESQNVRDTVRKMVDKFTTILNELYQDEALYKAVYAYSLTGEAKKLTGERAFFVQKTLVKFNRNGMKLSAAERDSLKQVNRKITELGLTFDRNITESKTRVELRKSELQGLSEDFISAYKVPGDSIYSFGLTQATFVPFMTYCENVASRKKMYLGWWNVGGATNERVLADLLMYRAKKAKLLGFNTYSDYLTADLMSGTPATVWKMENDLAASLAPVAKKDAQAMLEVKNDYTKENATVIYPYESAFYYNKLLKSKYNVDQAKVSEYFEIGNVTNGVFKIYQELYNIRFVKDENPSVWNKEVTAYSVFDNVTGKCIGYFYLDMYPRKNKYSHFACFPLGRSKRFADGKRQLITSALVCNFPRGENDKPSLLLHHHVETFFHEFGHLIHTILSETELATYGGTDVLWDFVEAPSQIMENWAWQKDVLKLFAKHYETGKVIPDSLLDNMIAAKQLNSGVGMTYQVFLGTLDMTLHNNAPPESADEVLSTAKTLYQKLMPYPWIDGIHLPGSFGHLNLYGSQYYGYLWSKVYAADMFSEFEKTGVLNPETGKRYRKEVLAKGGADNPLNLVTNFLGRAPNNKAFLKSIGVEQK